jgi:hypothetical protein
LPKKKCVDDKKVGLETFVLYLKGNTREFNFGIRFAKFYYVCSFVKAAENILANVDQPIVKSIGHLTGWVAK